jgi:hypothetical protein
MELRVRHHRCAEDLCSHLPRASSRAPSHLYRARFQVTRRRRRAFAIRRCVAGSMSSFEHPLDRPGGDYHSHKADQSPPTLHVLREHCAMPGVHVRQHRRNLLDEGDRSGSQERFLLHFRCEDHGCPRDQCRPTGRQPSCRVSNHKPPGMRAGVLAKRRMPRLHLGEAGHPLPQRNVLAQADPDTKGEQRILRLRNQAPRSSFRHPIAATRHG